MAGRRKVPLYVYLACLISHEYLNEAPAIKSLVARYRVCHNTIRKAVQLLCDLGAASHRFGETTVRVLRRVSFEEACEYYWRMYNQNANRNSE